LFAMNFGGITSENLAGKRRRLSKWDGIILVIAYNVVSTGAKLGARTVSESDIPHLSFPRVTTRCMTLVRKI